PPAAACLPQPHHRCQLERRRDGADAHLRGGGTPRTPALHGRGHDSRPSGSQVRGGRSRRRYAMRYGELFQFDPIETVIQLREADLADEARRLMRTYVISDRMAEQIVDVVLPHLRFD